MTEPVSGYEFSPYLAPSEGVAPHPDNAGLLATPLGEGAGFEDWYALMALDARNDSRAAARDILDANVARREAWERQMAAAERQRQAEDDAGFWGDVLGTLGTVAKVAGCVAAVAFAVCTAGAGTPVAVLAISGAVASCASLAQDQWGVFDSVLGAKNADKFGFYLGIGGAAMSLGAGLMVYLGASAGTQLAVVEGVQRGAMVVGGAAGVAAGCATVVQGHYHEEANEHRADALRARLWAEMQAFLIDRLTADMEEAEDRDSANLKRMASNNGLQIAGMKAAAGGFAQ